MAVNHRLGEASMKRNKGAKKRQQTIPVWTLAQANNAIPYLASVMQTAREYRLEAQRHDLTARRLTRQPGRPDRTGIIALQEALREHQLANDRFHEALEELHDLGIFCLDPIRGLALVPFAHQQELAWYVYDLFDPKPFRFWRFHKDGLEVRRPIAEVQQGPSGPTLVA
jgi:hypothetical protein